MFDSLPKKLKECVKRRYELVWSRESPLSMKYETLECENCNKSLKEAVVLSIGLSWRSGWLILCDECYRKLNYWDETEEQQNKMMDRYRVRVTQ